MRFRVEIQCDNAAFDGYGLPVEVIRILAKTILAVEDDSYRTDRVLVDFNGNQVGRAWFEEDTDDE